MNKVAETEGQRRTTLLLCAVLHAFTHLYLTVLPPLYHSLARDLCPGASQGPQVAPITLLVSAQSLAYCLTGLPLGFLADRVSRKWLLAVGLLANALAFVCLGYAPSYGWVLTALIAAGIAGGFYHPPANALVAGLYPLRQGKAIGTAGMGAAIGFFFGPLYGGWRGEMAGWRAPCRELGLLGLVGALLFALLAREAPRIPHPPTERAEPAPFGRVVFLSLGFGLRDFAAVGFTTFTALFLVQAHGFSQGATGLFLGLMSLVGLAANPLLGSLSDGPHRLRWAATILGAAALGAGALPWLPRVALLPGLLWFGFFQLASYPVVEAAISESVPARLRGRVFGVFLTSGGLLSSTAPYVMGRVRDGLVGAATQPAAFGVAYLGLAVLLLLAVPVGLPLLRWMRSGMGEWESRIRRVADVTAPSLHPK